MARPDGIQCMMAQRFPGRALQQPDNIPQGRAGNVICPKARASLAIECGSAGWLIKGMERAHRTCRVSVDLDPGFRGGQFARSGTPCKKCGRPAETTLMTPLPGCCCF
ncbi:hypothetical protein FALCPG4_009081 [Fusarium falciforme]